MENFYIYTVHYLNAEYQKKTHVLWNLRPVRFCNFQKQLPENSRILEIVRYNSTYPDTATPPLDSLEGIARAFKSCRRCDLVNRRIQTVHYRSTERDTPILFLGQSPGHQEDHSGIPFIGASGEQLADMLSAASFDMPYTMANLTACRPDDGKIAPERTDPTITEMVCCSQRLWAVINRVKPNIIIALGLMPALIFWTHPKTVQRNLLYKVNNQLYIGHTFHPAYICRKLSAGSNFENLEEIDFLSKVGRFAHTLKRFGRNDQWSLGFKKYPFQFLEKEMRHLC
jgi:uracil-DNA glycosylase family 4